MSFFDYPVDPQQDDTEAVTILEGLSDDGWRALLNHVQRVPFARGDEIIRAGERDAAVYILSEGEVEVVVPRSLGRERVIAAIRAGSVFGELAFFDERPRSATVRAVTAGHVLRLTRNGFDGLAAWQPVLARRILFDLGRTLAVRMRQTMSVASG